MIYFLLSLVYQPTNINMSQENEEREYAILTITKLGSPVFDLKEDIALNVKVSEDVPKGFLVGVLERLVYQLKAEIEEGSSIKTQGNA